MKSLFLFFFHGSVPHPSSRLSLATRQFPSSPQNAIFIYTSARILGSRSVSRFGNRWQQNGPHTFTATFTGNNPSSPANNNRVDGFTYDAAGNLLNDGVHTYLYDSENRLIKVDAGATAIYTYDGEGHRASKDDTGTVNSGGNTPDPSGTTEFVYDNQGHLVHTEAPNSDTGWRGEVFAGNRHLATYSGGLVFDHADWLGTERNRDSPNPNNTQLPSNQNLTSLPFGDWLDNSLGLTSETTPLNFTGQYHDFESNLDFFGARYYASTTGRFISPDWSASVESVPYADFGNPQSLNLYSYVKDNPTTFEDPDGHCQDGSEQHGWLWCAAHALGLIYTKEDKLREASNYFHNNDVRDANGNRINPDKLSDEQLLNVWKQWNDQWQVAVMAGANNPAAAMAGFFTQWGWRGQTDYNQAVDKLNEVNTPQGTADHPNLNGKVPTKEEAIQMIKDAGGKVGRIEEEGHAAGGVSTHQNPHINYTTASGAKGTVDIKQ
jgi:RHS repeat-associated protein